MSKFNVIFASLLFIGCSMVEKKEMPREFTRCEKFKDRLGCTKKDFEVLYAGMSIKKPLTARETALNWIGDFHERALGGVLKTTDFKPDNIHELRMYKNALSCIQQRSGQFDPIKHDLVAVEGGYTYEYNDDVSHPLIIEGKDLTHMHHLLDSRALALYLIGKKYEKSDLVTRQKKGVYGIHEGEVFSESGVVEIKSTSAVQEHVVYDCPAQLCIGRHFNGTCYFTIPYTVIVLPKSSVNGQIPVYVDEGT